MAASGLVLVRGGLRSDAGAESAAAGAAPGETGGPAGRVTPRIRIVDAALGCLADHGTARMTIDEVARRAGCSRATVYRLFPGGREEILAAVADTETARLFSALGVVMGEAETLEGVLEAGIVEAATRISGHRALSVLFRDQPELVLPHLTFEQLDRLLESAVPFIAPFLRRWLARDEAERVAEWAVRIVLSYLATPAVYVDLTDPTRAAAFVRAFVVPGVATLRRGDEETTPTVRSAHPVHRTTPTSKGGHP
jgi:AcrR family transcriptional regulator